jgi:hypothetical protein
MITIPVPHVMIFANNYPNLDLLTRDRWDIRQIELTDEELRFVESITTEGIVEPKVDMQPTSTFFDFNDVSN